MLAGKCLAALCASEPEIVIPLLGEFVEGNHQAEDPHLRETSLRCLRAVFGAKRERTEGLFVDAVALIAGRLGDEYPAVRFAAVHCLLMMLRQYRDAYAVVAGIVPPLLELARDAPRTAIVALAVVDSISKMADFAEFPSLFQLLFDLIPSLPGPIAANAFACFVVDQGKEIEPDVALAGIAFLIHSVDTAAARDLDTTELAAICVAFPGLIPKAGPGIAECAATIFEILIRCATEFAIGVAIEAAAALSISAPELAKSAMPGIMEVIMAGAGRVDDLSVVVGALHAIPVLCRHFDLAPFHEQILETLGSCLQHVTGAPAKSEVLCTFAALVAAESLPQELVLRTLAPCLADLVRRMNHWGEVYQADSHLLLFAMAGVLIQLLAKTSGAQRSDLFSFSLRFIRRVHQSPVVSQYLKGALGNLISIMLRLTGIEPRELIVALQATLTHIFPPEELEAF
jgi:phosphoribosylcarboxyaminoimidazole (NCAIR) mutase